jgi:hypothetical protein
MRQGQCEEIAMAAPVLTNEGLLQARRHLRDIQDQHPTMPAAKGRTTLFASLSSLKSYKSFNPTKIPGVVERGGFKYERKAEKKRIALAEELIRRTKPGPFEDPNYLAMLSYQAASIVLGSTYFLPANVDLGWSRFLLGTVHSSDLNAFAQTFTTHDYTVVAIYSALIDFTYQTAKATIAAQAPQRTVDRRSFVTTDTSEGKLESNLKNDASPIDRLYRTLEAYFYSGYPRAFHNETVPEEQMLPLTLLINLAERWIIGHEFGHGLAAGFPFKSEQNRGLSEEYFADMQATILTVMSAVSLDAVEPEFALGGGVFALAVLEVFQQAFAIVHHGELRPAADDGIHPSNEQRTEFIFATFDFHFDHDRENKKLSFVHRPEGWRPIQTEATILRRKRVLYWRDTLFAIWERARPRLVEDFKRKRELHPMWR